MDGESLRKYIERFSRVQYTILVVHPTDVVSVFHQNVRNRKMREELAMNKVKDVAEIYVLADRCARAKEGRKYPGKDTGAKTDSRTKTPPPRRRRAGAATGSVRARLCLLLRDPAILAPPRRPRLTTPGGRLSGAPPAGPWRPP